MHLKFRNVNDAFREIVKGIQSGTIPTVRTSSRVGEVLQVDEPVILTYSNPLERVLFNSYRDCNIFFHLYEALWMLAGRNDIASLNYYSGNYAKQVQDGEDTTANGAYGHRWRHAKVADVWNNDVEPLQDQLKILIQHLKSNPSSRRAVLQMWNVEDDLLKIGTPKITEGCHKDYCLGTDSRWPRCPNCGSIWSDQHQSRVIPDFNYSKDVCCNLSAMFSIRAPEVVSDDDGPKLDMTVTNRSNDLIWGTLGANYVHFSILQEYMAAHLGVEVGVYNQFSNNLHVYTERFKAGKWLADAVEDRYARCTRSGYESGTANYINPFPLVKDPAVFDKELTEFVEDHSMPKRDGLYSYRAWQEPFFNNVAESMFQAFHCYKAVRKEPELEGVLGDVMPKYLAEIAAEDWRIAATQWIERRAKKCIRPY